MNTYDRDWEEYPVNYDDTVQRDKFKKPYVMPRWLGSLLGMIATAILLWGNQILRMLNNMMQ